LPCSPTYTEDEHEAATGGGGIELLSEAFDAHATTFQLGDGFQVEAGIAAQAIQAIDQEVIEAV
jgi:hypothetical protein